MLPVAQIGRAHSEAPGAPWDLDEVGGSNPPGSLLKGGEKNCTKIRPNEKSRQSAHGLPKATRRGVDANVA